MNGIIIDIEEVGILKKNPTVAEMEFGQILFTERSSNTLRYMDDYDLMKLIECLKEFITKREKNEDEDRLL